MKKILFATVCATTLLFGSYAAIAEEGAPLPPPTHGEVMPPQHHGEPGVKFRKNGKFDSEKFKEKMQERADKFADELGLSSEQKEQAKKIHEEGRKEVEPLMKEMKELRKKMDALREKNMKAFEDILTPEQKDKLEKIKSEKKPEKRKWFKGNKRGHRKGEIKD